MKKLPAGRKPGGRPRRHKYKANERVSLSLRVTPQIKAMIDRASEGSGRSQSAEVEFRLEQSYYTEDLLTDVLKLRHGTTGAGVMLALSDAVVNARQIANTLVVKEDGEWSPDRWLDDPRCFAGLVDAIKAVLARLHPTEPAPPPDELMIELAPGRWDLLGEAAAGWTQKGWDTEAAEFVAMLPGKRETKAATTREGAAR